MKKFQAILDEIMEISRIPMILYNADGSCAAHYENTVLIKEDGVEILTL